MCTAVTLQTKEHYFGRNLDLEYSYQEEIVITPRNYTFPFRALPTISYHNAMIGMATVSDGYPLYYEATNEQGLSIAALNFPQNAHYFPVKPGKCNIAPFELIPYVLGVCADVEEVKSLLENINIADISFSDAFPLSPLHWMISDKKSSIVLEQTKQGLVSYNNPIGILTNSPPFPYHLENLKNYIHLSAGDPKGAFGAQWNLHHYSRGQGAVGLPGDWSSASRFVRAAFVKANSVCSDDEQSSVSQFFHILDSVAMPCGSVMVGDKPEITVYSCCCNTDRGIYYYKTYNNSTITAVNMHDVDLTENKLYTFPLCKGKKLL